MPAGGVDHARHLSLHVGAGVRVRTWVGALHPLHGGRAATPGERHCDTGGDSGSGTVAGLSGAPLLLLCCTQHLWLLLQPAAGPLISLHSPMGCHQLVQGCKRAMRKITMRCRPAVQIAVLKETEGKGPYCSLVMAVVVLKDVLVFACFALNIELAKAVSWLEQRGICRME